MTGATEEENETLSGDYVITVSQSNVNYAMSSAAEGNRLAPIVITPENPFKTDDETLVWTINKSGDNYTISQGENYLSWQGGSTNGATTSTSPYELVITKNKPGIHTKSHRRPSQAVFWQKIQQQPMVSDSTPLPRPRISP